MTLSPDQPATSVLHPAVLQVHATDQRRWTAAVWEVPREEGLFMAELHRLVGATLVMEWIQPPRGDREVPPAFDSFDLLFFEAPAEAGPLVEALDESGFAAVDLEAVSDEIWERLTVFQSQAARAGRRVGARPQAIYRLAVERPQGELAARLGAVCRQVEGEFRGQVWGDQPGYLSKVFSDRLRQQVQAAIAPTKAGLAMLEDLVVEHREAITWTEPMVFQALCDFMGVVWQSQPPIQVQWSLCEVDEQTGLAPPPVFRLRHRQGLWQVVEIGMEVAEQIACPWRGQSSRGLVGLYEAMLGRLK